MFTSAEKSPSNVTSPTFASATPPLAWNAYVPFGLDEERRVAVRVVTPTSSRVAGVLAVAEEERRRPLTEPRTSLVARSRATCTVPDASPTGVPSVAVPSASMRCPSPVSNLTATPPIVASMSSRPLVFTFSASVPSSERPSTLSGSETDALPAAANVLSAKMIAAALIGAVLDADLDRPVRRRSRTS